MKKGDFNRDEILLALDLYMQYRDDGRVGDDAIKSLATLLDREVAATDTVVRAFAWDDPKRPWRSSVGLSEEARRMWLELKDNRAELKKRAKDLEGKLKTA